MAHKKELYSVHTKNHHDVRRFGLFWMCVNCRRVINGYTSCLKIQPLTSMKHLKNVQFDPRSLIPPKYLPTTTTATKKHVRIDWFPPIHQFKSIFLIVSIYGDFHNLTNWRKKNSFWSFSRSFFSFFAILHLRFVRTFYQLIRWISVHKAKVKCFFVVFAAYFFLLDFKLKFSSCDLVSKIRREAPSP